MKSLTECFAAEEAKLPNPRWPVSVLAENGSLAPGCWRRYVTKEPPAVLCYGDPPSHGSGKEAGNSLLRQLLEPARDNGLVARLVSATPADRAIADTGCDASSTRRTFHVRPDLIGRAVPFDGDALTIDFAQGPS